MREKTDFSTFQKVKIKNFKTNENYVVQSVLQLEKDANLYQQITDVCNEKLIYHWLFKNIFPEGYPYQSAVDFISLTLKRGGKMKVILFSIFFMKMAKLLEQWA